TIRHNATQPALLDGDRQFLWSEFGARIARLAGALRALGIAPGARFAVLSRNGFRVEELRWAGIWLGAVPVLINWRLAPPEIAHILRDADCAHVFVEHAFAAVFTHDTLSAWSAKTTVFGEGHGPQADAYELLLSGAAPVPPADPDPDEDVVLVYTGGT